MQQLDKTLKIKGVGQEVTATQLKRENDLCLYEREDDVFEVFYVKKSEAREVFGTKYEDRESYPNNEDFGKTAWCFKTLDAAERKFNKLLNKSSTP